MRRSTIDEVNARVAGETVPRRFLELAAARPQAPMLHGRSGDGWATWTAADVRDLTARAAQGLLADRVAVGERVLLMMRNRPDFHWLDLAAQFIRATPVSIYNSSSPEEVHYLASDCGARIAIVEDAGFLDRLLKVRDELPQLERIYVIEQLDGQLPAGVLPAESLMQHGMAELAELAPQTSPDDLATLIYTSGTTGPPKGVMLSQYNVVYTCTILIETIEVPDISGWKVVSYLPMAHIAERMVSHYNTLMEGTEVYCCPDFNELAAYLRDVRPQLLFGVPRVYEKIHAGVTAALAADPDKQRQFDEGVALAIEIKRAEIAGIDPQDQRDTWAFLDAVAFSTVRELIGLDQLRMATSGAAPIPAPILEWFTAIGVPLSEIYGMSESSGPMTYSPKRNKPGYVGQAIPGCEVRLADDGEIVCRGGNVFVGYLNQPQKTAETLIDGWLHSGDIGVMDDEGYFKIVDRKKELIITSGGKNISPANLEAALKMIPLVGQACVIGDARKYIAALLVLDADVAPTWATAQGKGPRSLVELAADPDVIGAIQQAVDEVNEQFAQVEQIKRFTVLGEEWLPDSDVLTPTSKLKRRGVHARYAREIEAMYA
ncbi:MAG TPA: AMP-binding protein [Ilumatobacter sp.]|nr:AMP-binding protein [Ilumatobacter sp.]